MRKPPLLKSISGRLLLLGVIPAMLAIAAVVFLSALDAYHQLRDAEERTLVAEVDGVAAWLTTRNDRWNNVVELIALAQTNGLFGERDRTSEFLRSIAESLTAEKPPLILGAWVVYEPDADGNDAKSLAARDVARDAMDAAGRFLPYWFIDERAGAGVRLKPNTGMETLEYYQGPKAAARSGKPKPFITEPYVYEGVAMISHAFPIVIDGRFVGVAGIDRGLDTLEAILNSAVEHAGVDVFVLNHNDHFIVATTDRPQRANEDGTAARSTNVNDKSIADSIFAPLREVWVKAASGNTVLANDPQLDEPCFYAGARVPTGGWTVIVRRTQAEVMAPANAAVRRNTALGLAGLVLVGGLMFMASRAFSRRVQKAVETADRIAEGDLTHDVEVSGSGDETGMLLGAMGAMSGNLNGLAGSVRRASIQLNSTATEMTATAKQQEAAAASFGAASSEIAAAVKEISATSQDLVRTMDGVNVAAGETAALATSGRSGLEGMEAVMRDLDRATGSIAEKLAAINERSQKITTVVTTITRVADQTNILSINAAIEAEKAGEYGGGFLVIAREIRRLADQTAGATLDIEQMVQQMQAAVGAGVMEMDRFADQVRRGVRDVATVGSQLGEIIERVNASTQSFHQVSESMQSQAEGAQQISGAMVQLTGTASQTTQSIHEFGRAAEDLQAAIASLRESVARFRLKD